MVSDVVICMIQPYESCISTHSILVPQKHRCSSKLKKETSFTSFYPFKPSSFINNCVSGDSCKTFYKPPIVTSKSNETSYVTYVSKHFPNLCCRYLEQVDLYSFFKTTCPRNAIVSSQNSDFLNLSKVAFP